ncbi:hypothetical protein CC117_00985 [Parafrankia colletiae]|uniref:Heparin-sulfate lyase N-terminal domain-containing protein n=1 Tax=Parafrankia colletiae TaxID=573497 RepID=A0A1S1RJD9_9ACTN|nr:alginate lyase family protein [Parafrankia colletiae]OHV46256.1 hypothetical protein CC117_00985 [Parafrankia colletiae]
MAWAPYVASLRAWTLCALEPVFGRDDGLGQLIRADLRAHQRFLVRNLERDLGGNHLLKNLKALLGLAAAAGDRAELARWSEALAAQARAQVLQDGGHIERSPSYHVQVLADLTDVAGLLGALAVPLPNAIGAAVDRMSDWLATIADPDGYLPALNDGFPVSPSLVRHLVRERTRDESVLLADSGFAVLRTDRLALVADVGGPGPGPLGGHSHAGTLGFELRLDGRRFVMDPGTSTYEASPRRAFERSTRAHPTVCVDGLDSSEVWGAFRTGRRSRVREATLRPRADGGAVLSAWHDGYRYLRDPVVHQRRWDVGPELVTVSDRLTGRGRHQIEAVFPLDPAVRVTGTDDGVLVRHRCGGQLVICTDDSARRGGWQVERALAASGWNRTVVHDVAVYRLVTRLPVTLVTRLRPIPAASA